MLDWIDKADAVVHGVCTRISHRLQRATGLTCYFIARIGVGLTAINVLSAIVNYYFPFLPERSSLLMVVLSGLILLACIQRSIDCQKGEDSIGRNVRPTEIMSYNVTTGSFWRMLWIVFSIFTLRYLSPSHLIGSFIQNEAFGLGTALFYNFIIVIPLPPGTSKLREWVRGFFAKPAELAQQENN